MTFERSAVAKVIAAIAEFDERRLFLPLGFTSLFAYCTNRLGFSQDEAFYRIQAARVVRRFPIVLDYLEKHAINLSTARLLGPHLTADNHHRLLETASHQKRPEIDLLIARLRPKPDVPSTIRKLPDLAAPRVHAVSAHVGNTTAVPGAPSGVAGGAIHGATGAMPAGAAGAMPTGAIPDGVMSPGAGNPAPDSATNVPDGTAGLLGAASDQSAASPVPAGSPTQHRHVDIPARRPIVAPLSESSYRLQITISRTTHDKLREIQALIRHVIPSGDPAAIVERSLDLLLADLRKKKLGQVGRPRPARETSPRGRHIPAHVKRRVWERDGGRCAFVSKDGVRCDEDGFVEYHHVTPYARGGKTTVDNIQLRCRAHNAHEAELAFGRAGPR